MDIENIFSGTVYHQLDDKGRVRIPSRFFPKAEEGEERNFAMKFYFMAGTQGCISVYLKEGLDDRIAALRAIPNTSEKVVQSKRKILGSIESVETDKQGRAVIPPFLRTYAKIGKELVTVGMDDHFEIWAKEEHDRQDGGLTYAQAYSEVGFF